MSVHLAMPACCCGLSSWMWCGDNSGKAKQQTHYSSKYIHLGCARDWNIIHFPHFIAPAVELGLPGPHSAIPAELAPGTARQRTQQNFTFPWIKPSRLGLLRVTHPIFSSPLIPSSGISHQHTPRKCSCQKGKIPHKNSSIPQFHCIPPVFERLKFIFTTVKMAGENLDPNS